RRIAAQGFTKEARSRYADHSKGMAFNDEGGAHNGSLSAIGSLPGMMAEDSDGRRGRLVIFGSEQASAKRAYAKGGKIVSINILRAQRTRRRFNSLTTHAQASHAGLECGYLLELRRFHLEALRERIREHPP